MSNKYKNISVISSGSWVPSNFKPSKKAPDTYQVQINELILNASIGIHDHEKISKQKVSISLSLKVLDNLNEVNESIKNVVSYEHIIKKLKTIITVGHIELLETLGEKIFEMCFEDQRILSVWLKLEKLEVFKETKSVGIEILRERNNHLSKGSQSIVLEKINK